MEHIYLPIDNFNNFNSYVIINGNIIRAYEQSPHVGSNNYTDFYINSHYLEKTGVQEIQQNEVLPTSINKNILTNSIEYRNDAFEIFGFAFLLFIISVIFPYLVFRRLFGRWLKI